MEQRIAVTVRIRPALNKERYEPLCARKTDDCQNVILKNDDGFAEPTVFQFDDVYDGTDDQHGIYEQSVQELVDHALQGANSTVFTYGQTGSGKTYTILGSMTGESVSDESGIFPRVFSDLFSYRNALENRLHVIIYLSAVELYVEDVMDLLEQRKKIKLRETPEETITPGLNSVEVKSMKDVMQCFQIANSYRSVTSTKMNDSSSRSHALFFIDIFQVPVNRCPQCPVKEQLIDSNGVPFNNGVDGLVRSRISLVDLAGSERVKRSGVEGQGMVEAQAINKSLSALGTSINAMYMQNNHIPFRDSKLTKLLKTSFVDRSSRLLLIGQVAPPSNSAQESMGTLRFCDRVKGLKAGRVTAFLDPEEEEHYLRSLRLSEEITADLRIVGVEYYHKPQRITMQAGLKGVNANDLRQSIIANLKGKADSIIKSKETEEIRRREADIQREFNDQAQKFVDKMNTMIEEYEEVAREVKREKKLAKRAIEEEEAVQSEQLTEAKRAKKKRLRLVEKMNEIHAALEESNNLIAHLATAQGEENEEFGSKEENDVDKEAANEKDKAVHALVECFYSHATELGRLHQLFVQRLHATQRQRTNVRRAKLFSSDIITDSTMVYDIIDFMIDRAVDISDGAIAPTQSYSWNDIEGLSSMLRTGDQLYPPLSTRVNEKDAVNFSAPMQTHKITFLSSDDSDEENSHYPKETRRRYVEKDLHPEEEEEGEEEEEEEEEGSNRPNTLQHAPPSSMQGGSNAPFTGPTGSAHLESQSMQNRNSTPPSAQLGVNSSPANVIPGTKIGFGSVAEGSAEHDEDDFGEEEEEDKLLKGEQEANKNETETADPKKEALKKRREHRQHLMRVYDSTSLVQDLLRFMRAGTVMMKHGRKGKPHRRVFWISTLQNSRHLLWMDPDDKASERSTINLDMVNFIQLGCFSKVFRRHPISPSDPAFYRCFSIGIRGGSRTVDLVANNVPDFEAWIVGLSNLVRVDPTWGGKLDVTKESCFDQLNCFEASLCEANYIYPTQYVNLKKRAQRLAVRTLAVLEKCGNDSKKAQGMLASIHPPGINDKGAVFLTKGELRFLGREDIDILRITKIWIQFQQMNLVYDDNFVPATTFGVTHRC